jgi:ring-1,2-phenylacetyl-CoA epoxidase subunit PaaC
MARMLWFAAYQEQLYAAQLGSSDPVLAGVAGKAVKEVRYHLDHARQWVVRLGDGTDESHERMSRALDELWPYRGEIASAAWHDRVAAVLIEATLPVPEHDAWTQRNSADGWHTEHLGYLLAEMQSLARAHPGATW